MELVDKYGGNQGAIRAVRFKKMEIIVSHAVLTKPFFSGILIKN